jgi:hypothetical protein
MIVLPLTEEDCSLVHQSDVNMHTVYQVFPLKHKGCATQGYNASSSAVVGGRYGARDHSIRASEDHITIQGV